MYDYFKIIDNVQDVINDNQFIYNQFNTFFKNNSQYSTLEPKGLLQQIKQLAETGKKRKSYEESLKDFCTYLFIICGRKGYEVSLHNIFFIKRNL
jgi:hypothetical protein